MGKKKPTRAINVVGPFAGAKVGDWVVTEGGEFHRITAIEPGGVRISKYLMFSWDGTRPMRSGHGRTKPARLATTEEIEKWESEREVELREGREANERERRAERVRDAAPDLLAACQAARDLISAVVLGLVMGRKPDTSAETEVNRVTDLLSAAITKAGPQAEGGK